ncbi:hypothetical protein [Mucilaginibacter humi]|nr:hypothetical protein [Mucilaginibacter humi]
MAKLKNYIASYAFENTEEEITFLKRSSLYFTASTFISSMSIIT